MRFGGTLLIAAAILVTGGCSQDGKLEIRAIGSPLASGSRTVSFRVAEAHGQFALGNVALALESFRKAAREDPTSIDALVGIAACYDRMGRFDLSRRNYEAALALAPGDSALLTAFAASLDQQQLGAEAARVRSEIGARMAAAAAPVVNRESAPVPSTSTAATALLPLLPTTVADAVAAALETGDWLREPPPAPVRQASSSPARRDGPRLERLSMGEVKLITVAGPQWQVQQDRKQVRKPLTGAAAVRQAAATRSGIRVYNAARVDRLAWRARSYLVGRGWSVAQVGDVELPRARSLIVYPSDRRAAAAKLSSQLGFAIEQRSNVRQVTVLLGRDAADLPILKASGG